MYKIKARCFTSTSTSKCLAYRMRWQLSVINSAYTGESAKPPYSTVSLVPPISTVDVWRYLTQYILTSRVHSSVKHSPASPVTAAVSCDGLISVLNHCPSWLKFVNTHLYHFSQWFIIHIHALSVLRDLLNHSKGSDRKQSVVSVL